MEKKKASLVGEFTGSCGERHKVAVAVDLEWAMKQGPTDKGRRIVLELETAGLEVRELVG